MNQTTAETARLARHENTSMQISQVDSDASGISYGPNYDMPFMRAPGRASGAGFPSGQYANNSTSTDSDILDNPAASNLPPNFLKKRNAGVVNITAQGWNETESLMYGGYAINRPVHGETRVYANGFVLDSAGKYPEVLVQGVPSNDDMGESGIARVWQRYKYLENKSDPNSLWDRVGSIFSGKLDNPATTLTSSEREERSILYKLTYERGPIPEYQRSGLTNSGRDYWMAGLSHSGNYPTLDARAGQYRDRSGAAVAYISPAVISPWSNPIIQNDPGSKAYQARLAHENEKRLNVFFGGLGVLGRGASALEAISNLYRASEPRNIVFGGSNIITNGMHSIENAGAGRFYNVDSGGVRGGSPLTSAQRQQAERYLSNFDTKDMTIRWVDDTNLSTGYGDMFGQRTLNIGSDLVPGNVGVGTATANSRVSINGTLAHELVGHMEAGMAGRTQSILALEEAQASIRAARFAPDLTSTERFTLMRDGIMRLQKAPGGPIPVREVKSILYIHQR